MLGRAARVEEAWSRGGGEFRPDDRERGDKGRRVRGTFDGGGCSDGRRTLGCGGKSSGLAIREKSRIARPGNVPPLAFVPARALLPMIC